jgi:hypothetical protein
MEMGQHPKMRLLLMFSLPCILTTERRTLALPFRIPSLTLAFPWQLSKHSSTGVLVIDKPALTFLAGHLACSSLPDVSKGTLLHSKLLLVFSTSWVVTMSLMLSLSFLPLELVLPLTKSRRKRIEGGKVRIYSPKFDLSTMGPSSSRTFSEHATILHRANLPNVVVNLSNLVLVLRVVLLPWVLLLLLLTSHGRSSIPTTHKTLSTPLVVNRFCNRLRQCGLSSLLFATNTMESNLQFSILISKMVSEFSESFGVLKAPEWVVPMLQLVSA